MSSFFKVDNIKNEPVLRLLHFQTWQHRKGDFFIFQTWQHQKRSTSARNGKLHATLTASYQCVLRFFQSTCLNYSACHEKVMPGHTKCCTCHAAESSQQTWRSDAPKCNPSQNNQRPDLLTALMKMSLVLRLPRKMHLCRSCSNVPRLPSFLEMLQNPHVLLTFDKVHTPLRLPRETTSEPRTSGALYILTSKCASGDNGVHFFDISTSKRGPELVCFVDFEIEMCFTPQQRALFRHRNFQKWSERQVFFPRASVRRVLLIVGVCQTFSHLHIFTSHLLIFICSSSHLLIFTSFSSSHLLIFTFSHLHIFSSSHLHIFSSSNLLIFKSSHLHIFTPSHPHILTSSHLHILTSSHLHILTSSHLLIFTSSRPHILTSSHPHIFTSSHLPIFSSSHLHILTSSHLDIFTFSLALLLSCPLALLPSFLFLSWRRGAMPTRRHETQPFRTKWISIARFLLSNRNPFARNEVRSPKTREKLRFWSVGRNPFARNEARSPKTVAKLRFSRVVCV